MLANAVDVVCPSCRAIITDREIKPFIDAAVYARLIPNRRNPAARLRSPSPPHSPLRCANTVVIVPGATNVHTLLKPTRSPSPIALPTAISHQTSSPVVPSSPPSRYAPVREESQSARLRRLLLQGENGSDQFICSLPPDFWSSSVTSTADLVAIASTSY